MTPTLTAKPTHARYWVIVFAVTLAILSYIDRVCISQAMPVMSGDLGLSELASTNELQNLGVSPACLQS
jgi:hypothetical protein